MSPSVDARRPPPIVCLRSTSAGSVVYATAAEENVTYAAGSGPELRRHFEKHHKLHNSTDKNFRQIGDNKPSLAFVKDLGTVSSTASNPFRLYIGRYRSPAISWTATEDVHPDRDLYYHSKLSGLHASVGGTQTTSKQVLIQTHVSARLLSRGLRKGNKDGFSIRNQCERDGFRDISQILRTGRCRSETMFRRY